MSVRTTADERIEDAVDHIQKAIKSLSEVVHEECWGCDSFSKEYTEKIEQAYDGLRKIKKLL